MDLSPRTNTSYAPDVMLEIWDVDRFFQNFQKQLFDQLGIKLEAMTLRAILSAWTSRFQLERSRHIIFDWSKHLENKQQSMSI